MKQRATPNAQQALERLATACAKTEYCEDDLRRKLRTWGVPSEDHDEVINTLRAERFIDDSRYCRAFAGDKWTFNHWGKTKIRMSLRLKHLPDEEIDEALQTISDEDYRETLSQLLRQKSRTLPQMGDYERYQRLARFAIGRGFEPDAIRECLERGAD